MGGWFRSAFTEFLKEHLKVGEPVINKLFDFVERSGGLSWVGNCHRRVSECSKTSHVSMAAKLSVSLYSGHSAYSQVYIKNSMGENGAFVRAIRGKDVPTQSFLGMAAPTNGTDPT